MPFRSAVVIVVSALMFFSATVFAADADRSTSNEQETFKQLAEDLFELHQTIRATNLAPKIADHVIAHGKQTQFNVGTSDAGTNHVTRFYSGREIYVVSVKVYESGKKTLNVDHFMTNRQLDEYAHPADPIAEQLIMGTPKIYIESHFYDDDADGTIEIAQQFLKKDGPVYLGFSREERDLGVKAGVMQYTLDGDKVWEDTGWREATDEEIADARMEYTRRLGVIAEKFQIR